MAEQCKECMQDAPYKWCCKTVCMEIEVCRSCEAKCKEVVNECPMERGEVGDKVQVVDNPISLLKQHTGIKGEIVKKGIGNEWLVELGCEKWWTKGYDIEVITQNQI